MTGRKRTEEAFLESEKKYRLLIENANEAIVVAQDDILKFANSKAIEIIGYSIEELPSRPFTGFIHPEDREMVVKNYLRRLKGERFPQVYSFRVVDKNGKVKWMEINAVAFTWENRPATLNFLNDITERKRMEDALRESEEKLRNIVEHSTNMFYSHNSDHILTYVSPQSRRLLGYEPEEIMVRWTDLVTDNPINKRGFELTQKAIETGKPQMPYELELADKQGRKVWVEVHEAPIVRDDKTVAVVGALTDITDRKKMEDDLRRYSVHLEELVEARTSELGKSEQELRRIYDSSMNAIYTLHLTGQIADMNPAGINMLGLDSLNELKKFKLLDFCMNPEDGAQILKRGYKDPVIDHEMQFRRRDGRIIDVILNGYPVKDETGETVGIRGAIIDITERKELERRLIAAEKMAAVGETTAMVGHDLRNPLQAIVGALYAARKRHETLPENVKRPAEGAGVHEILETIEHQVKYMNKIVADLQDYSRVIHPSLADVSLSQVIKDTLSTAAVPATVKIKVDLKKNLDRIVADPDLMKRVFSNLINNAAQAMPDGGTLTIKASKEGEDVLIRFQDTGEGIPKENLDRLFNPFFTTKAKGQGLGLAVCKRLVEAHSGTITVESKAGKGSTFTVKLPQRKK